MLAFLSVAFLIYGVMHIYALAKVWLVFPHSPGLGLTLGFLGLVMTFSPLILWHMTKQNWHGATVVTSWAVYVWMGFLFCFVPSPWYSTQVMQWQSSWISSGT